jgi:hypothetical protein
MFQDFARIGSLMTDGKRCFDLLVQLNDKLVKQAETLGVLKEMTTSDDPRVLKTQATNEKDDKTYAIHKHHKVMTSFFNHYEGVELFNTGVLPKELQKNDLPQLPKSAPTLTQFVNPADFRKYLFQYAYHWKDVGVGWAHGEFTHRIHWYMVIEHLKSKPTWLTHEPIALFRACALPQWRHATNKNMGVWDNIVDEFGSATFRSPNSLHGYLKAAADPTHLDHKELWLLAQLIAGRAAKRLEKKKYTVPENGKAVGRSDSILWKKA